MQRHQVGERLGRNHHACCVYASVTNQPLQLAGGIHQLAHLGLIFVGSLQLWRVFQRLIERNVQLIGGHHLGDAIHFVVGNVHGAANVFDRRLGGHGPEGNNLRHLLAPILVGDVVNHLAAPVHAEINVNIGHGNAFRIQEALEQQLVLQGINVRN